jgi:NhaA family Na+:H+ antiporter
MSSAHAPISELTFLGQEHRLSRWVGRPLQRFMEIEAAAGGLLVLAAVAALVWANSPWGGSYSSLWETPLEFQIGGYHMGGGHHLTIGAMVNDALMALFFFVAGLEIKRELVSGQLRDPRAAALPALAALGGMIVPACIFFALNAGGEHGQGWGIPMATDIAFAVGVVALLGKRVPHSLKIFLLTLAVVDDIGAILVIAFFYSESPRFGWLAAAAAAVVVVLAMRRLKVWYMPTYIGVGCFLWLAMFESGIHATIAGVILGLLTPAKPVQSAADARRWAQWLREKDDEIFPVDVRFAAFHMRESTSVAERLVTALHPFTSFVILPIFALANAGVALSGDAISEAATSSVTLGVALGLVAGKTIGVFLFTWLGSKTPFATMPADLRLGQVLGMAMVAGVGFTVALFVAGLAFDDAVATADAKVGILAGSFSAAILGAAVLARACKPRAVAAPAPTAVGYKAPTAPADAVPA